MRRRIVRRSLNTISDINLTPLMDLSFLLLVTFVITFPLVEQHIRVNLPIGKAEASDVKDSVTISVELDGNISIGNERVSPAHFEKRMQDLGARTPDVVVMVRADEGLKYGRVAGVLKVLRDAGLTKTALVTREE